MTQFQNMKNTTSMKLDAPCSTDTHPSGQQISIFPYGTHWFISILANPHQWALPYAGCSHSTLSQTISLTSTVIQSSHPCPCDPNVYFSWSFLISTVYTFYITPFMLTVLFISFSFLQ
jgi:hypothetical protein